ncbi:MAG: FadR family transcriptional regulator [Deltaproteobacteria bacterium]|nr:FadR family transcriptional regulator [Deltaproteobacteria bacterium]
MTNFKPIKNVRVFEDVLVQLKAAILLGAYRSGDELPSERELTMQFQVSRGVIRKAIRALELSGFVVMRQGPAGGGAFVTDFSFNHVGNAFLDLFLANKVSMPEVAQVRSHVEPKLAQLAALHITPEYQKQLEDAEKEVFVTPQSYAERIVRPTEVHHVLAQICGNHIFESIVRSMLKLTGEVVLAVEPDHEALHNPGKHHRILDSAIKGDGERASREMEEHLKRFSDSLIEMGKIYREHFSLEKAP